MKVIILALLSALVQFSTGQTQTLGPEQVCRCYSTGSTPVCNSSTEQETVTSKCSKQVQLKISFVADDGAILWICGGNVRQTSHAGEMQTFSYNGMCDDLVFEVYNQVWSSGVSLLVESDGKTYGTTDHSGNFHKPGVIPLFGIAKMNPTGDWRSNPDGYPFWEWTPAVVVTTLFGTHPNFDNLISNGAYPINVQNGNVLQGTYGVKVGLPSFCP